jgi:hypothetical protein
VVIYNSTMYPAIVGDMGPNYKIGEASLRICKELNALANANNRPVSELKVTYLVFPNSADKPFDAPDLDKWHTRCDQLLTEMGGYQGELKAWVDLTKPKPTPTPSPTATPSASPASSGTAAPSGSPAVSGTIGITGRECFADSDARANSKREPGSEFGDGGSFGGGIAKGRGEWVRAEGCAITRACYGRSRSAVGGTPKALR